MRHVKRQSRSTGELPAWCDDCRVRIAPYEDFVTRDRKAFHRRCFRKSERIESPAERLLKASTSTLP
jgi:hypothetical protein